MKQVFALLFLLVAAVSTAQEHCGFLMAQEYLYKTDPTARQRVEALIRAADEQMNHPLQGRAATAVTNYTIPVVFHVLHMNGPENISDAQIQDQINVMNIDYSKQNADTINVVSQFQGLIGNPRVEFRLATLDPNGNCTTGITRHYDPNTNWTTVNYSNYIYTWDPTKYLNIYVVKATPAGAAAYAFYPGTVPAQADGIVVQSNYVGSIGTGQPYTSRIITHEAGHWMNLQHLWGNNNAAGVACGDDGVSDTPITKGFTYCNLSNGINCTPNVTENMQNYMDYAYCQLMFTPGQCTRMQNALNSSIGGRNNLWTTSNLIATGVINPVYNCAPVAAFIPNGTLTCVGNSLSFTDVSYNAPVSSWKWSSPLASNVSTQQNGSLTFTASGVAPVKLKVSNSVGSDSITQQKVYVLPAIGSGTANVVQGFESGVFPDNNWLATTPPSGSGFAITGSGPYNGVYSAWLDNYYNSPSKTVSFFSPAFSLQYATSAQLTFYYAYAQQFSMNNDRFRVYMSSNCGTSWQQLLSKNGSALNTAAAAPINMPFVSPQPGDWQQVQINLMPYAGSQKVYFKFEFTPDTNGVGNDFYVDDINLDAQYSINVGLQQYDLQTLSVAPNPFSSGFTISGDAVQYITAFTLTDVSGRVVLQEQKPLVKNEALSVESPAGLASGVYFMRISTAEGERVFKVIRQ